MEVGSVVKAVYDFTTEEHQELPLVVGDIVQVLKRVDKQWTLGFCNGRKGNFPTSFVIEVKVPVLMEPNYMLFAPISDFIAQEHGDLSFKKGDLVVGIHPIDNNWWLGQLEDKVGIFPLTHVWMIDKNSLPTAPGPKRVSFKARVKTSMKAQLPEEMNLVKDEIVTIIEEVGEGWLRGECNGRSGTFPATFVTPLTESELKEQPNSSLPLEQSSVDDPPVIQVAECASAGTDQFGYDCVNSGISAYGRTVYPFKTDYPNELNFDQGEIVSLIRHVNEKWMEGEIDGRIGIFPKSFVDIIVDCSNSGVQDTKEGKEQFPGDTYGRVLIDFNSGTDNEPKLTEGDTVTLISKLDQNWYEVMTDSGSCCICPSTSIEVIGNCPDTPPPSYSEVAELDKTCKGQPLFEKTSSSKSVVSGGDSARNERPFSYPSYSFDQASSGAANRSSSPFKVSHSIDDKIVENLFDLDLSQSSVPSSSPNCSSRSMSSDASFSPFNDSIPRKSTPSPMMIYENANDAAYPSPSLVYENLGNASQEPVLSSSSTPMPSRPPISRIHNIEDSPTDAARPSSSRSSSLSFGSEPSEIRKTVAEKEEQLRKLKACKAKLEGEILERNDDFFKSDIRHQVTQCEIDIENVNVEIQRLNACLPTPEVDTRPAENAEEREAVVAQKRDAEAKRRAEEQKKKMKEQRACVVTEILQTERDYISDLKILCETFLRDPEQGKAKGIDMATLFGNLDEVVVTATGLLRRLEKMSIAHPDSQMIGGCFVDMADEMKEVYGHYCRNHDDVNAVLDKYDERSAGGKFLKVKVEVMQRRTNCFDLPSMLIKPVQRILKYPLLLNELVKCTEDGHPDKQSLIKAVGLMTDVATAINEFKRRKDLVFKYRKHADTSLSGRISKLSLHSMLKKSSRFGIRLSSTIGLKSVTKDENFEKQESQFHALEKTIKIFMKDVNAYIEKTEELVKTTYSIAEDIAELYQERRGQADVDKFQSVNKVIFSQFWKASRHTLCKHVLLTLKQLLKTYEGPNNLIRKRYDKLLDYESCVNKVEKNKDVSKTRMLQDDQQAAKNTYEALNSQLLDDLPKLYSTSIEILRDCIYCFLNAKKGFIVNSAKEIAQLPVVVDPHDNGSGIMQTFQVKHNLVTDSLSHLKIAQKHLLPSTGSGFMKRNSSPKIHRLSFGSTAHPKVQTSNHQILVKSTYSPAQLYNAHKDYVATDLMDMNLKKGDIVGVIKQQDPTGSKFRWFVDNGATKGFVPAKYLVKFLSDAYPVPTSTVRETQHLSFGKGSVPAPCPPYSSTLPRNNQKVVPEKAGTSDVPPKRPDNCSASARPVPLRPAPVPLVVDKNTRPPLGRQSSQNNSQAQSVPNICKNIVQTDPQTHRYEEIPDFLEDTRYDTVSQYVPSSSSLSNSQNNSSASVQQMSIEEFDPYSASNQVYDNVPNGKDEEHRYEVISEDSHDGGAEDLSEYYCAMYEFVPLGPNQLKVMKGQVVLVLHKCDLNQNSEWWFVEDRHGNKGYVPGYFLKQYANAIAET